MPIHRIHAQKASRYHGDSFFLGRVALKLVVTKLVGVKLVIKFVAIYASGGKLLQEATGSLQ